VAKHGFQCLAAYGLAPEEALATYRVAYPRATPADLLAAVETDWWCRMPAILLAEIRLNASRPTYVYEFAWPSPLGDGLFGACHALEIPFVFDTLDQGPAQMIGPLLGPAPPQELAKAMHKAWVAFARHGDPGWPRYAPSHRAIMRFDVASRIVNDPHLWERTFWKNVR
jgi:para-nitrobenzyl esterase